MTTSRVTDTNPPGLTASPKTPSTRSGTTNLLPAATTPQQEDRGDLAAPGGGVAQPTQDLLPEDEHQFQGDLQKDGGEQGQGEAFADHRRDVLDGEVQDHDVDEDVDHNARTPARPPQ